MRPLLKWAGGKTWLVPYLAPLWQLYRTARLVEPFCGSAAVSLALTPDRAWLNDRNPHLINLYRWIRRGLAEPTPLPDREAYERARDRFNALIQRGQHWTAEAARLFWVLNRSGYHGLCRFNRQGRFNVPYGEPAGRPFRFAPYRRLFQRWTLTCQDFATLSVDPDDVLYLDPPYDRTFSRYTDHGFSWNDQGRVLDWIRTHPGPVWISNCATTRIVSRYRSEGLTLWWIRPPRRVWSTGLWDVLAIRPAPSRWPRVVRRGRARQRHTRAVRTHPLWQEEDRCPTRRTVR